MVEVINIITCVVFLLIGIFIGKRIGSVDGFFLVNDSDSDTTKWTLDVHIDPETIPNKKEVRFKVYKMTEGDV